MQVIYDNDGIAGVKLHETLYSPQALAAMAGRVEALERAVRDLRDALETVRDCASNCADCRALAAATLSGEVAE